MTKFPLAATLLLALMVVSTLERALRPQQKQSQDYAEMRFLRKMNTMLERVKSARSQRDEPGEDTKVSGVEIMESVGSAGCATGPLR
jgi:hypothetical protein